MTIDEILESYKYMLPFSEGIVAVNEVNVFQYSTLPKATLVHHIINNRSDFNESELKYIAELLYNSDPSNLLMCKALIESKVIK